MKRLFILIGLVLFLIGIMNFVVAECTDTDGDNYFLSGNVTIGNATTGTLTVSDYCLHELVDLANEHEFYQNIINGLIDEGVFESSQLDDTKLLIESYCPSDVLYNLSNGIFTLRHSYSCQYGCEGGACTGDGTCAGEGGSVYNDSSEGPTSCCEELTLKPCVGACREGHPYPWICINETCKNEGETYSPNEAQCCEGLTSYGNYEIDSSGECKNINERGKHIVCINCGNDICGSGENKCNCPEDCNETEECEWQCTSWSECVDGVQTRTCENVNSCTGDGPKTEKTCKEGIKEAIKERNRIRFEEKTGQECADDCTCMGRVMKCQTESGREMTVYAASGNIIFQVKGINASTSVTLYHHNKTTYGIFKGNQTKEIKVLPDQVKEKVRARIQARLESFNMSLEDGYFYKVEAKKRARLFFIFPVRERIEAQVDPDTGQVAKIRNPWWGFLARDIKEE